MCRTHTTPPVRGPGARVGWETGGTSLDGAADGARRGGFVGRHLALVWGQMGHPGKGRGSPDPTGGSCYHTGGQDSLVGH
ncbi:unnamed protein product [Lota lota]